MARELSVEPVVPRRHQTHVDVTPETFNGCLSFRLLVASVASEAKPFCAAAANRAGVDLARAACGHRWHDDRGEASDAFAGRGRPGLAHRGDRGSQHGSP